MTKKIIKLIVILLIVSITIFLTRIFDNLNDKKMLNRLIFINQKYETQRYLLKMIRPRLKVIATDSLILKNLIDGKEEKALENYEKYIKKHKDHEHL